MLTLVLMSQGQHFSSQTHLVDLTPSTIAANSRFFEKAEDVPKQAISMGLASIMSAKMILLMAFGEEKQRLLLQW